MTFNPNLETPDDRAREADAAEIAAAKLGLSVQVAPRFHWYDATFRDRSGTVVAIGEIKSRNVRSDHYPTFKVSASKYKRLRTYAIDNRIRGYLIVDWLDRIGIWDSTDRAIPPIEMGGRVDRGLASDVEPMVCIHPVNFSTLYVRNPPRQPWR